MSFYTLLVYQHYFRGCHNIITLEELERNFRSQPAFKLFPENIKCLRDEVKKVHKERQKNLTILPISAAKIKQQINTLETRLTKNTKLRKEKTVAEMEQILNENCRRVCSDIESCNYMSDTLKKIDEDMQTLKTDKHKKHSFIIFRHSQDKLSETESLLKDIKFSQDKFELTFQQDGELESSLKNTALFGGFNCPPPVRPKCPQRPVLKKQLPWYEFHRTVFNISTKYDKHSSEITDLHQSANGDIVIADKSNHSLKLYSELFDLMHVLELDGSPSRLCKTRDNEYAVVVHSGRYYSSAVVVVKISSGKLCEFDKHLSVTNECGVKFIASHGKYLYTADHNSIYAHSVESKQRKHIFTTNNDDDQILDFWVSDHDGRIYALHNCNDINVYDSDGKYEGRIDTTDTEIGCEGVQGSIFLGTLASIFQLDNQCRNGIMTVATNIQNPECLWFNKRTNKLFVGQPQGDLLILTLRQYSSSPHRINSANAGTS